MTRRLLAVRTVGGLTSCRLVKRGTLPVSLVRDAVLQGVGVCVYSCDVHGRAMRGLARVCRSVSGEWTRFPVCPVCGGAMVGDGYTLARHCEATETPQGAEPDSGPWYCCPAPDASAEGGRGGGLALVKTKQLVSAAPRGPLGGTARPGEKL